MNTPKQSPYDLIADFYDRYWTTLMPDLLAGILERLLPDPVDAPVFIDLCCGTGNLVQLMLERGYNAAGVDASAQMLDRARANAPRADFILDDVTRFTRSPKADIATCMFDSVNHFLTEEELGKLFINVHNNLNDGGVFVFDINDETGFSQSDGEQFSFVEDEAVCVLQISYDETTRLGDFAFTLMNREGDCWKRTDLSVPERYHPVDRIVALLRQAGFTGIQVLDGADDLGIEAFSGRQFIRAWV